MIVEIISIGQEIILATNEATQILRLRLSDGSVISASVDADTVARVVRVSRGEPDTAVHPTPEPPPPGEEFSGGFGEEEFGGDYSGEDFGGEVGDGLNYGAPPEPPAPREMNVIHQPIPGMAHIIDRIQTRGPVARVLADDRGYPINVTDPPNDQEDEDPGADQA